MPISSSSPKRAEGPTASGESREKGRLFTRRNAIVAFLASTAGAILFALFRLQRSPDSPGSTAPTAALQKGLQLHRDGEYGEAIKEFTRIVRSRPELPDAYMFRGIALSNSGRFGEAIGDFTRALELRPGDWAVYLYRGEAYLALGNKQAASEDFGAVVQADPEDKRLIAAAKAKLQSMER